MKITIAKAKLELVETEVKKDPEPIFSYHWKALKGESPIHGTFDTAELAKAAITKAGFEIQEEI